MTPQPSARIRENIAAITNPTAPIARIIEATGPGLSE